MMKIINIEVYGLESAMRAMRNPKNSWGKSDSVKCGDGRCLTLPKDYEHNIEMYSIGQADRTLSQQLTRAGGEHCKHLRMVQVWFDLDAPRYMWQEFDTYKHTEKISCSTMHKLFERELTLDDFENFKDNESLLSKVIGNINTIRKMVLADEGLLRAKSILPESFLQKRTVNTNYQQLLNIYIQRKHHKLPVWKEFCKMVEELPYFVELTGLEVKGDVE